MVGFFFLSLFKSSVTLKRCGTVAFPFQNCPFCHFWMLHYSSALWEKMVVVAKHASFPPIAFQNETRTSALWEKKSLPEVVVNRNLASFFPSMVTKNAAAHPCYCVIPFHYHPCVMYTGRYINLLNDKNVI